MKSKILMFIIGVLFGAVISTGAFYVYTTTNCSNNCGSNTQMNGNGGTPPEMPSGQNSDNNQNSENGQPPEKPDESNTNNTQSNS
ncbi:MAG: hypothetical protein IJL74_01200 [Bacilli bacterium]|nr:hypothetical protein [Bacilli bacterium]